ncbi:hypothetical protein DCCM_4637 [Desulfocucumis palustris]|uniref:Uncharacterized protein n=1 Tax=Desulfocucumis palustris TaxID=1898651 RepID=A0A2L2XGZ1_9FIRM|nr:hypothetical protein [Desulfocucumis palustris]GBF35508.1 hypothetical protein DCCM_4637 [Desulfocucumis palustris]
MDKNTNSTGQQDEVIQKLTRDIMKGARLKLVEPVLDENRRLLDLLQALQKQERDDFAAIKARLELLEHAVQQIPLLILSAIRDAINQAGVDVKYE